MSTSKEPTTPEKCPGKYCVYSSVPTCPFDGSIHVATPEKKCCDESMLVAGYIKTPSGWIAHGEATPGQMTYHFAWLKNKKK